MRSYFYDSITLLKRQNMMRVNVNVPVKCPGVGDKCHKWHESHDIRNGNHNHT